jgi:hypothetical protein
VVAESDMNWVTTPTAANSTRSTRLTCQPWSALWSQLATRSAVPLVFMAAPSGIAPAMKT